VIRVVGIGNPARGDDAAGREVARRLRKRKPRGLDVRECDGDAGALLSAWEGAEEVVVVDACRGAGSPGSVHVFEEADVERLGALQAVSTHTFGVVEAVGLARALGRLPSRLVIYALEGGDFRIGTELTPPVDRAVDSVVALLVQRTGSGTSTHAPTRGKK
jgi:hydrogenase maturation protease